MGICSYRDPTLMSRLAQLVERKSHNLGVVGSSPTVGVLFAIFWPQLFFFFFEAAQLADQVTHRSAPVAQLAARGSHNPKVASSILVGSICLYSSVWQSMRLESARSRVRSVSGAYASIAQSGRACA